jgi:hypothetical protein
MGATDPFAKIMGKARGSYEATAETFWQARFNVLEVAMNHNKISIPEWNSVTEQTSEALKTFEKALIEQRGYGFFIDDINVIRDTAALGVDELNVVTFFGTEIGVLFEDTIKISNSHRNNHKTIYSYLPHVLLSFAEDGQEQKRVELIECKAPETKSYEAAVHTCQAEVLRRLKKRLIVGASDLQRVEVMFR